MKRNESNVYKLVLISLMIALTLILNRVIPSTPIYHLTVDFVPVFIVGVLFGPLWSAATYAIADTIGSIIMPMGPFNPGITFTLLILGGVFGLVYYKRETQGMWIWIRALICAVSAFVIKLFGTTYFLYIMYGGPNGIGYFTYVLSRIPNCFIFAVLVFLLLPTVQKVIIERLKKLH